MVYFLRSTDGTPDFFLDSRGSTLASPHPATGLARSPMSTAHQMLSVIDIPQGAPPGRRTLFAQHRKPNAQGVLVDNGPPIEVGPIDILPAAVAWTEVVGMAPTPFSVIGQSTPFPTGGSNLQLAIPDPQIVIVLPGGAHAAHVRIAPSNQFNPLPNKFRVVDAFESYELTPNNHRPIARWQGGPYPTADFVSVSGQPFYEVAFVSSNE